MDRPQANNHLVLRDFVVDCFYVFGFFLMLDIATEGELHRAVQRKLSPLIESSLRRWQTTQEVRRQYGFVLWHAMQAVEEADEEE